MKAPAFWYKNGKFSRLLSWVFYPLSLIYGAARKCDMLLSNPVTPKLPSITIGGLTVGGAGKTPVALSVYQMMKSVGYNPFIISRGYGGKCTNESTIVRNGDHFKSVGDEALMLAEIGCNVLVGKNKLISATKALQLGADCLVFDDALQTTNINSNLNFLVIDGKQGIGNGKLLPAGPLREPIKEAFKRTDAVVLLGSDQHNIRAIIPDGIPVFSAKTSLTTGLSQGTRAFAFCGLGFPSKFFESINAAGISLVGTEIFPDHYCYEERDVEALIKRANALKAKLITTRKDFVKIPKHLSKYLSIADINVLWSDQDSVLDFIKKRLHEYFV